MQNLNFSLSTKKLVFYILAVVIGGYFLFLGLAQAKVFLAPLVTAIILALVILPLCQRFERKMNRSLAALLGTFIIFLASLIIAGLVFFQMVSFTNDWPEIKKTMKPKIEQATNYIVDRTPIDREDLPSIPSLGGEGEDASAKETQPEQSTNPQTQQESQPENNEEQQSGPAFTGNAKQQESSSGGSSSLSFQSVGSEIASMLMGTVGFLGTYLLVFIYIYFLLRYRSRFEKFLIRVTQKKKQVKQLLSKFSTVTNQYLLGKLLLMGLLAVVYSIGLGISGVSNFILVSVIAAVLTLIPYIGNIIGFSMAILFGYLTTGDLMTLVGIALTFTVSQFIESYVLMPYVVGDKVDVHPFFVILGVIVANLLWGVIGMVLAVPVLAIITILLLHIDRTKAIGLLLSKKDMKTKTHD